MDIDDEPAAAEDDDIPDIDDDDEFIPDLDDFDDDNLVVAEPCAGVCETHGSSYTDLIPVASAGGWRFGGQ